MTDWAREIGETPQEAYERGRAEAWERVGMFAHEAYERGRIEEFGRMREFLADVLSGLIADYGDVSRALQGSMRRLADAEHNRRRRAELRQMILKCREINHALGKPRGYVYTGGAVPLDKDGNWIEDTDGRQAPSDDGRHRQQRATGAAHPRQTNADGRGIGRGQQRDIGSSALAQRDERRRRVAS